MYNKVKTELIERFRETGKIGFTKPSTESEAYQIIETLAEVFSKEETDQLEETVISLVDITERLRNFFKNFN